MKLSANRIAIWRHACALICSSIYLAGSSCWAQPAELGERRAACDREFGVRIGNEGKDVIWVPTHDKLVTAMLSAAGATSSDFVIDLGSGDGKIPIAASQQFGARALGIEYDLRMVKLAQCYVQAHDLSDRVEIRQADIFDTDISRATIVTLYLLPKLNMKLRPTLLELEPGTRIVSNRFKLGRWQPDRTISLEGVANQAYLWHVPARLAGTWRFESDEGADRFAARFDQEFQKISAKLLSRQHRSIRAPKLVGRRIELTLHGRQAIRLAGEIAGNKMSLIGTLDGREVRYVGTRD